MSNVFSALFFNNCRVKSQAAQLAERDAMIAVLQKHSSLGGSRTSSVTSLLSSPLHSPLPTLTSPIPSSLSSLITSTVASIMSLSQSLPSSGTTSPSRQSSVLSTDSSVFQEPKTTTHTKSSEYSWNSSYEFTVHCIGTHTHSKTFWFIWWIELGMILYFCFGLNSFLAWKLLTDYVFNVFRQRW